MRYWVGRKKLYRMRPYNTSTTLPPLGGSIKTRPREYVILRRLSDPASDGDTDQTSVVVHQYSTWL